MSTDQAVRLRAVLDDLENNRISTADAASQLRTMKFPAVHPKTAQQTIEADADSDVPVAQPGSFREVAAAYVARRIDLRQYEALAEAAAEAMNGKDE